LHQGYPQRFRFSPHVALPLLLGGSAAVGEHTAKAILGITACDHTASGREASICVSREEFLLLPCSFLLPKRIAAEGLCAAQVNEGLAGQQKLGAGEA
jgi:hypothetical protein